MADSRTGRDSVTYTEVASLGINLEKHSVGQPTFSVHDDGVSSSKLLDRC